MNRKETPAATGLFSKTLKSAAVLALVASALTGCATTGTLDADPAQSSFENVHHGA
jgi:hypothetical protein